MNNYQDRYELSQYLNLLGQRKYLQEQLESITAQQKNVESMIDQSGTVILTDLGQCWAEYSELKDDELLLVFQDLVNKEPNLNPVGDWINSPSAMVQLSGMYHYLISFTQLNIAVINRYSTVQDISDALYALAMVVTDRVHSMGMNMGGVGGPYYYPYPGQVNIGTGMVPQGYGMYQQQIPNQNNTKDNSRSNYGGWGADENNGF